MNTRRVILCLVAYYLPGYKAGGAMRTIANMTERLGEELEFRIITTDRDHGDDAAYPGVTVDAWNTVGKASVFYASRASLTLARMTRLMRVTPHDVLYLNSFFDPVFTLRPLLARRSCMVPARPTVIAPRGEFSDGALSFKSWKKNSYRALAGVLGLYRDLIWQASSHYEAADIRAVMGSAAKRIATTPDLPPGAASAPQYTPRPHAAALRVCFLSRISPKKNLDFALQVLGQVRSHTVFDIYGPIEDAAYWRKCEDLMAQIGGPVSVHYKGSVEHERVGETFGSHDLFFFPTHGENFGHVILESLLAGTPVLTSNTTPWRDLSSLGVGWDLPLGDERPFIEAIESAARKSQDEYRSWRQCVQAYARRTLANPDVVEANRRLFFDAAACRSS